MIFLCWFSETNRREIAHSLCSVPRQLHLQSVPETHDLRAVLSTRTRIRDRCPIHRLLAVSSAPLPISASPPTTTTHLLDRSYRKPTRTFCATTTTSFASFTITRPS